MTDARAPEIKTVKSYFKWKDGDNKIRILTSPITGYVYFTKENKPKRFKEIPDEKEVKLDIKDTGKVKEFRAFIVYNYDEEAIQVMEITQKSIMNQLSGFSNDKDYGSPLEYDIKINRTGQSLDTEYQVKPLSKTPVSAEVGEAYVSVKIDLEKLYEGGHPLTSN